MGNSPSSESDYARMVRKGLTQSQLRAIQNQAPSTEGVRRPGRFVVASYLNQTTSCLIRLPDTVLVAIMKHLEPQNMTVLRHVSREFMRLFHRHPYFNKYHCKTKTPWMDSALWSVPDPAFFYPGQAVGSWAPLCRVCSRVREGDHLGTQLLQSMPVLYCSACKEQHRIMHFSWPQRMGSTDADRVCIGHEGHLRLDNSWSISWAQAQALSKCPPSNYAEGGMDSQLRKKQSAFRCPEKTFDISRGPIVELSRAIDQRNMRMVIRQRRHFAFKRESGGKVGVDALRAACVALSEEESTRLPRGQLPFRTRDIMRAFDPNVCSCVDWGESSPCITTRPVRSRIARRFEWQLASSPAENTNRRRVKNGYVGSQGRCLGQQHGFSSQYAAGSYLVDILQCPDDKDTLVIQVVFRAVVSSATDPAWLCNLSFDSCLYEIDEAMHGVTWCQERDCGVALANVFHQSLMEIEWKYGL